MAERFEKRMLAALALVAAVVLYQPQRASASCGSEIGQECLLVQDSAPPAPNTTPDVARPAPDRSKLANRLDEIGPLLSRCLRLPAEELSRPGMRITVRLAFTRSGDILGEPRFTFITHGVSPEIRAAYQRVVADMLDRCTPLAITPELGGAIAGRPFVFPIVDRRGEKNA
jgi:hypothetical protein